jgi:predicted site-specific integrase-resolvase
LCGLQEIELTARVSGPSLYSTTNQLSPEQEMVEDLLFSARLYGLRNYRKKLKEARKEDIR